MQSNVLIVSDLHFGEDLLPGASEEKRRAVAMGASAFCEFLQHHRQRRMDGRPWRLVVAGDLFDFMAITLSAHGELPARTTDERRAGRSRSAISGPARLRLICAAHQPVLQAMVRFAAAGNQIDLLVGNHDLELLEPATQDELRRQLLAVAGSLEGRQLAAAVERIVVRPWFLYLPGVAWIEHGHAYDEACSSDYNLAPNDPETGELIANVDYAAVRYLAQAAPELDPHGTEEWGFGGYVRYAMSCGWGSFVGLIAGYVRFTSSLLASRRMHRSTKRRRARQELHRQRMAAVAEAQALPMATAQAIDRLARAPVTKSARRLFAMLMLDRWATVLGGAASALLSLALLSGGWRWLVTAAVAAAATFLARRDPNLAIGSQVPMLAVPDRIRSLVDAPLVVFGHTHDPKRAELRDGGVYLNCGTWLPASRPGILRSFTHVVLRCSGASPDAEIRQWRDGRSVPFDEVAPLARGSERQLGLRASAASPPSMGGASPAAARAPLDEADEVSWNGRYKKEDSQASAV
jgi:UDP-2,3-diacylglucosamine pyrophosphatase LpxH